MEINRALEVTPEPEPSPEDVEAVSAYISRVVNEGLSLGALYKALVLLTEGSPTDSLSPEQCRLLKKQRGPLREDIVKLYSLMDDLQQVSTDNNPNITEVTRAYFEEGSKPKFLLSNTYGVRDRAQVLVSGLVTSSPVTRVDIEL